MRGIPPGEHDVGVGVACAGARGAPLDGVDLFTVSLEVVDTGLLLHAPDLHERKTAAVKYDEIHRTPIGFIVLKPWRTALTFKVMSSEQEASSMPDGSHLMALTSFCRTPN